METSYKRRHRPQQPDVMTLMLSTIGDALWKLVTWPFRRKRQAKLDRAAYRAHWESIGSLLSQGDHGAKQAVLDADKLVDQVFRELGLPGESFGERLRAAENRMSKDTYQGLWEAHKLRNQIAHEVGAIVRRYEAEDALGGFERGLRALGAL